MIDIGQIYVLRSNAETHLATLDESLPPFDVAAGFFRRLTESIYYPHRRS